MLKQEIKALQLREAVKSDLDLFFNFQLDPEANFMAAFTSKDPSDKEAYLSKWTKLLESPGVVIRTILEQNQVVGSVLTYEAEGTTYLSYWIGKEFWGRGIASQALFLFLKSIDTRPVFAYVAADNIASVKVLEKCGFVAERKEKAFANARAKEIDEILYKFV